MSRACVAMPQRPVISEVAKAHAVQWDADLGASLPVLRRVHLLGKGNLLIPGNVELNVPGKCFHRTSVAHTLHYCKARYPWRDSFRCGEGRLLRGMERILSPNMGPRRSQY